VARLQHQTARLTIALKSSDDVSDATGQVTRAITAYGGHIATLQFATPEGTDARSEIVAKVPIERMQEATARFTALGRLAGAQVDISDLQERADTLEQRVSTVRLQIARFDAQLAATGLTRLQKATLVERRARARQRLADLNANVAQTKQEAALADLTVILVTDHAVAPAKSGSGAGDQARDALGLLADIGVVALYAAIVAAPLLLAAAALIGGRRLVRRRRDRRLLETA
jgi:Fe2+ transport system protein FeoA